MLRSEVPRRVIHAPSDAVSDRANVNSLQVGGARWKDFRNAVDDMIAASTGAISAPPPPPKN